MIKAFFHPNPKYGSLRLLPFKHELTSRRVQVGLQLVHRVLQTLIDLHNVSSLLLAGLYPLLELGLHLLTSAAGQCGEEGV